MNLFSISAALMYGSSKVANNFELVIMARIVGGVYAGIIMGITPLFLTEISPNKYRGAVGSNQKVFLALGIVLAQTLGIFALNTEDNWHILLSLTGLFSLLHLLIFPPCPGSPRWLIITDRNLKSAKRAIKSYYGLSEVGQVVDEIIIEHVEESKEQRVGVVGLFTNPNYRLPLLISVTVFSSVQLCGIPTMYIFAGSVFEMIWPNDPDAVSYAIVGMGLVEFLASCSTIYLVDRVGRRPLLLYNFAIMIVLFSVVTLSLTLANPNEADAWAYISVVCIYSAIFCFAIGPACVSFIIVPELWSQGPRPTAVSIAVQVQWWSGVLINFLFPYMQAAMDAYMFAIFVVILIYYTLFTYFLVPETKLKSFEEIAAQFRSKGGEEIEAMHGEEAFEMSKIKSQ
ncbi:solute carrier family 2, facilitated glucose transporter member 1-like isoform X2 [Ptychodera flava]